MNRIILHWTAGSHRASAIDREHYHFIVEGDGNVVEGVYPVSANESTSTPYAAHTRGTNTGSIGVAVAAMHGAKERPFRSGDYPITHAQLDALAGLVARLADKYGIPVTGMSVLTHAEVQPTLGIKQSGKWDITWIPGMAQAGDPVAVGDAIRKMVRDKQAPKAPPAAEIPGGFWAFLARLWAALTGGKS